MRFKIRFLRKTSMPLIDQIIDLENKQRKQNADIKRQINSGIKFSQASEIALIGITSEKLWPYRMMHLLLTTKVASLFDAQKLKTLNPRLSDADFEADSRRQWRSRQGLTTTLFSTE